MIRCLRTILSVFAVMAFLTAPMAGNLVSGQPVHQTMMADGMTDHCVSCKNGHAAMAQCSMGTCQLAAVLETATVVPSSRRLAYFAGPMPRLTPIGHRPLISPT
jgi:hypothetical protein